jgi:hypothetical protein
MSQGQGANQRQNSWTKNLFLRSQPGPRNRHGQSLAAHLKQWVATIVVAAATVIAACVKNAPSPNDTRTSGFVTLVES